MLIVDDALAAALSLLGHGDFIVYGNVASRRDGILRNWPIFHRVTNHFFFAHAPNTLFPAGPLGMIDWAFLANELAAIRELPTFAKELVLEPLFLDPFTVAQLFSARSLKHANAHANAKFYQQRQ